MEPSEKLLNAVVMTATLMGSDWTREAAKMFLADLAGFPEAKVIDALKRCRLEVTGRLTVAHVQARIDDGRPGPDEAYANLPRGEEETVVWTREASIAWEVARHGETEQSRRQAFRERYVAEVAASRSRGEPPRWLVSEGWDAAGRAAALEAAVAAGKLPATATARLGTSGGIPLPRIGSKAN